MQQLPLCFLFYVFAGTEMMQAVKILSQFQRKIYEELEEMEMFIDWIFFNTKGSHKKHFCNICQIVAQK